MFQYFSQTMSTTTTSTTSTAQVFEHFLGDFYSRRLLLHTPLNQSPQITPSQSPPGSSSFHDSSEPNYKGDNTFDANVVMVLSVLLCALICSSGLNSIIRCTLRCSRLISTGSSTDPTPSTRLANTGVKRKALKTFPTITYSTGLSLPGLDTECVICLSEFAAGERVRLLPNCNHWFHVRCIDKWLSSHSSCPTCRHCLIETCQKIVGSSSISQSPAPVQELRIVTIVPLEPEGLIRNYSYGN